MRFLRTIVWLSIVSLPVSAGSAEDTTRPKRVIEFDSDGTPRPVAGDVPAYVKETDVDWLDDRLRRMDTGRTWNATCR